MSVDEARQQLREQIQEIVQDVPEVGLVPDPDKWMQAIEAFIDAKLAAKK